MTKEEYLSHLLAAAEENWPAVFGRLPDTERLRLASLEQLLRDLLRGLAQGLWACVATYLAQRADQEAKTCRECGYQCQRRRKPITLDVLGFQVEFECAYYYCGRCRQGNSPVRRWLGLEDGGTSLGFERATTDLTSRMSFGEAVASLQEQQGQTVDRTKAERVTYRVADEALEYLDERRGRAFAELGREGHQPGVSQLVMSADGGGVPVGELQRPKPEEVGPDTKLTPVRQLPKGTRPIQTREARIVVAHELDRVTDRIIDCHVAPYGQTEFTGARMLGAAIEAGLGDQTRVHGVFDMAAWIQRQFNEQFALHERTAAADIMHVTEYLTDAGRVLVGSEAAAGWGQQHKHALLLGHLETVVAELRAHTCPIAGGCQSDDDGTCLVKVALRYLTRNRAYLDYPALRAAGLPIGSGEAESGVRHLIKRRVAVPGAWREHNAHKMLALISIRASGWWDDFWRWRDQRDLQNWWQRQRGEVRPRFRGFRGKNNASATTNHVHA